MAKFLDQLTGSEWVASQNLETAIPVDVWYRLQPVRSAITCDDARKIQRHNCDDDPQDCRVLHTNLQAVMECSVHRQIVDFDDFERPTIILCPAGHQWSAASVGI